MFNLFSDVKIQFDFHARDSDYGDAIICSEIVIPSDLFSEVATVPFNELILSEGPEELLKALSQERDQPLSLYLKHTDFLYFLALYLKSTLTVSNPYILDTYWECLNRVEEIQILFNPSESFRKGLASARAINPTEALQVIASAPQVDYLTSTHTLPLEILLTHWSATGEILDNLTHHISEMSRIHLISLHDEMVMGGLISDELKPYTNLETKCLEACGESKGLKVLRAKLGKTNITVDEYAKREIG